ncbi:MAG: cation:proton antiporter [Alphaproteobacteria bacterium]|nr:cation:proton antiporter [Alphaproteobacteria bacterium]
MDFGLIAIAFGDVAWIAIAFVLGLLSRTVGLPPLVGFLVAGFLLNLQGIAGGDMLRKLSDLGITLLLFIVGLKLNLRMFARPQVWAVTGLHMTIIVPLFATAIYVVAALGAPFLSGLDFARSLLIAFALSFSSTVFVVKALEDRGQTAALHGRIAIGILIVQDLAAVVFLAVSAGQWPTYWALLVLLVFPLRPLLTLVLQRVGHGELMVLYGFLLALGGAQLFELVGLKGDLGALVLGVLIANHAKADEMAKTMLGFKDFFLLAFFLSVGLSGRLTLETLLIGAAITPFVLFKSALFFGLLTAFRLQARTSLLATLNLSNFSEFGLIVAAIGVAHGWIDTNWLIVVAVALALSCVISSGLNVAGDRIYTRYRGVWKRLPRSNLVVDDRPLDIGAATIAVIGMGRVGSAAYDTMRELHEESVVGVDSDLATVERERTRGRKVLLGDPGDADFWDRVQATHTLELVMLALPNLAANLAVIDQLKAASFGGRVAATARFQDEIEPLEEAGASTVFNVYAEAGSGFAAHVAGLMPAISPTRTDDSRTST